ncbi:hypothetical protein N779_10825 [Vibrio coralliilyticus OCN008]|nr:hypothetical protein N779_10825 [Vibrio coralliilyticus OCN008]
MTLIEIAKNRMSFTKKKLVTRMPSDTFQVFGVVRRKLSVATKITAAAIPETYAIFAFLKPAIRPIAR